MTAQIVAATCVLLGNTAWAASKRAYWKEKYRNPQTAQAIPDSWLFGGFLGVGATVVAYLALVTVPWVTAASLMTVATLGWLNAAIDAHCRKLPVAITGLLFLELSCLVVVAFATGLGLDWNNLVLGALVWVLPPGFGYLFKRQVGLGDVLFAPILGLWLGMAGIEVAVLGLLVAVLAAGLWSALILLIGRGQRESRVPFGPFLWGGAMLAGLEFFVRTSPQFAAGCEKLFTC